MPLQASRGLKDDVNTSDGFSGLITSTVYF